MRITADTNILLRAALNDHPSQSQVAREAIQEAERVIVTIAALCEFVWVTRNGLSLPVADIAASIEALLASSKVDVNRSAAMAGLAQMLAGGDFADGAIAKEGSDLGGVFVTFDKKAATLFSGQGGQVALLR